MIFKSIDINGTNQVLAYVDDVNVISDDIRKIERNFNVLLNVCKDIGSVVNTGKAKYMEIGHYRDIIANEHMVVKHGLLH